MSKPSHSDHSSVCYKENEPKHLQYVLIYIFVLYRLLMKHPPKHGWLKKIFNMGIIVFINRLYCFSNPRPPLGHVSTYGWNFETLALSRLLDLVCGPFLYLRLRLVVWPGTDPNHVDVINWTIHQGLIWLEINWYIISTSQTCHQSQAWTGQTAPQSIDTRHSIGRPLLCCE